MPRSICTIVSEERSIIAVTNKIFVSEEQSIIAFNYTKNSAYSPAHRFPVCNSMSDPLLASSLHFTVFNLVCSHANTKTNILSFP